MHEGETGLKRVRSSNMHSTHVYARHLPKGGSQPTGGEGCVDLEKVNAKLLEVLKKARAEKEKEEMRAKIAAKAALKAARSEERVLEGVSTAVRRDVDDYDGGGSAPKPRNGRVVNETSYKSRRESYPSTNTITHGYNNTNPSLLSHHPSLHLRAIHSHPLSLNLQASSASGAPSHPSPLSLLTTAHTRISLPPLSLSLSPSRSPTSPLPLNPLSSGPRRGSYDRPDWSESDEAGSRGGGLGVSAGLRLLIKKSEGVLRRKIAVGGSSSSGGGASGGGGVRRRKEGREVGERAVPERTALGGAVMRMKNDSVVSRVGWRCGCWMK